MLALLLAHCRMIRKKGSGAVPVKEFSGCIPEWSKSEVPKKTARCRPISRQRALTCT